MSCAAGGPAAPGGSVFQLASRTRGCRNYPTMKVKHECENPAAGCKEPAEVAGSVDAPLEEGADAGLPDGTCHGPKPPAAFRPGFRPWPELEHWAAESTADPAGLLTMLAAVLGSIAGPEAGIITTGCIDRSISPSLLFPAADLCLLRQLEGVVSQLRTLQERLRRRPALLRSERLEEAVFGGSRKANRP